MSACATTLDEHTDKVQFTYLNMYYIYYTIKIWFVTGSVDRSLLISGGADSMIYFWWDITEKVQQDEVVKQQQLLLR